MTLKKINLLQKARSSSFYKKTADLAARHPNKTLGLVLLFSLLLLVSRRPSILFHAQFWAEDGAVWYADAYNHGFLDTILQTYAGYFAVIHRFVAGVALLLPLELVPLFFNCVALLFYIIPIGIINSAGFKHIVKNRASALVVTFLYIGLLNINEIFGNLANIQWPLALSAFLIIVAAPEHKKSWRIRDLAILVAAGVSGPAVILLTPIAGYIAVRTKNLQSKLNVVTLFALSTFQLSGLFIFSHYPRVSGQPDANLIDFTKMLAGQIFTGGTLGMKHSNIFYSTHWALYATLLGGIVLMIYGFVKGPYWLKLFIIFGGLMFFSALASLGHSKDYNVWTALTYPGGAQRYWFVPIATWVTVLLWITFRSGSRLFALCSSAALLLLVFIGLPTGWLMSPLTDLHFDRYTHQFSNAHTGERVEVPVNPGLQMTLIKK